MLTVTVTGKDATDDTAAAYKKTATTARSILVTAFARRVRPEASTPKAKSRFQAKKGAHDSMVTCVFGSYSCEANMWQALCF